MAQLPSQSGWLIQQNDGTVSVFNQYTDDEVVKFDPSDANATATAQHVIYLSTALSDEDKTFAHFWSGYFHAHASPSASTGTEATT